MTDLHDGISGAEHAKRAAMLCVDALVPPHGVRVVLAPSGRIVADASFGAMSRARIAGYTSREGTAYADVLQRELEHLQHTRAGRVTRYLVLVADGVTSADDLARCTTLIRRARGAHVHCIGIGVGDLDAMQAFFRPTFGAQYLALSSMDALVEQMQTVLQRIARTVRRRS
jgi:hypothetical protein